MSLCTILLMKLELEWNAIVFSVSASLPGVVFGLHLVGGGEAKRRISRLAFSGRSDAQRAAKENAFRFVLVGVCPRALAVESTTQTQNGADDSGFLSLESGCARRHRLRWRFVRTQPNSGFILRPPSAGIFTSFAGNSVDGKNNFANRFFHSMIRPRY